MFQFLAKWWKLPAWQECCKMPSLRTQHRSDSEDAKCGNPSELQPSRRKGGEVRAYTSRHAPVRHTKGEGLYSMRSWVHTYYYFI